MPGVWGKYANKTSMYLSEINYNGYIKEHEECRKITAYNQQNFLENAFCQQSLVTGFADFRKI